MCPRKLPIPFFRIQPGYDLSGSSFVAYSFMEEMNVQTNRLNPDSNQNDFDSDKWTQLGGNQVIFQIIKSSTDEIQLQGLFSEIKVYRRPSTIDV